MREEQFFSKMRIDFVIQVCNGRSHAELKEKVLIVIHEAKSLKGYTMPKNPEISPKINNGWSKKFFSILRRT